MRRLPLSRTRGPTLPHSPCYSLLATCYSSLGRRVRGLLPTAYCLLPTVNVPPPTHVVPERGGSRDQRRRRPAGRTGVHRERERRHGGGAGRARDRRAGGRLRAGARGRG